MRDPSDTPKIIAVPKSGCLKIKKKGISISNMYFISSANLTIGFLSNNILKLRVKKGANKTEGWIPNPKIKNHLLDPLV